MEAQPPAPVADPGQPQRPRGVGWNREGRDPGMMPKGTGSSQVPLIAVMQNTDFAFPDILMFQDKLETALLKN